MACSSPRRWGTPGRRAAGHVVDRFIPTPVGNAGSARCAPGCAAVHPHARGERSPRPAWCWPGVGSSPRPWGTRRSAVRSSGPDRFIPTPVGNALTPRAGPAATPVHPHARGERKRAAARQAFEAGSSPRPWGTQCDRAVVAAHRRFIPTPVGNAPREGPRQARHPVHPHARGERDRLVAVPRPFDGSSPRPWGTLLDAREVARLVRFIPTPVGNAWARNAVIGLTYGSSPRPWGTPAATTAG